MIFVATGSGHQPFDRLVKAMDGYAHDSGRDVLIQQGSSRYPVKYARHFDFRPHAEFVECYRTAELIVAHTSTAPLIYARMFGKPIIVLPRYTRFGERAPELEKHQIEISEAVAAENEPMRSVVFDIVDLVPQVERLLALPDKRYASDDGSARLHRALRAELNLAGGDDG